MSCSKCHGEGMYQHPERNSMVLCSCPAGERKKRWLRMSEEEKRKERRERKAKKKTQAAFQEEIPF